ncbi:MAG: 30S ribosomal protein S17e [Candidatus Aenigmarchaeota archaeon]|nr:30S ribosomal protein S17e [Candidatus Aenigmarchaeota archaeon]
MGRIKTAQVKSVGKDIFEKHSDKFTADFSKNKQVLRENFTVSSKKLENVIAGYITKLKRQAEKV